jgi:hypothetical protein
MHISKLLAGIGFLIDQTISLDVLFKEIRSDSSITEREVSFKIDVITSMYKVMLSTVNDLLSVIGEEPFTESLGGEQRNMYESLLKLDHDFKVSLNAAGTLPFHSSEATLRTLTARNLAAQQGLVNALRLMYRILDEGCLRVSRWGASTEPQSLSGFIFAGKNPKVGPLRPFRPEDYWEIYKASLSPDRNLQKIGTADTES